MCNKCHALISTPILMDLPDELHWLVRGVVAHKSINARQGNITVPSPINDKRLARALLTLQIKRRIKEMRHDLGSYR